GAASSAAWRGASRRCRWRRRTSDRRGARAPLLRGRRTTAASRRRGWPGTRRLQATWTTILRLLGGLFPADLLGVGPEPLDVVELPLRLVEDVEHDVAEILEHPAGV